MNAWKPNGEKINGKHKNKNFTREYEDLVFELKIRVYTIIGFMNGIKN